MKVVITILALVYSLNGFGQRYLTDDFPTLDSTIGGIYGNSVDYQSNSQSLLFDLYQPSNDTLAKRPLIIYIHGGGFNSGSRTYPSVQQICRRMANKGYVVANIDYRLDPNFDIYNSTSDRRAMTDAMHDAKQAIRYFKTNASTLKIDTSLFFIGGESAGAATSMMASFIDKQTEMSSYPKAIPNNPVGSLSNSNVSNKVKGTLCLCGLLLDTLAMETPTDPSVLWTHGSKDNFIPIALAFNIVLRATNIGIPITAKTYEGANHCPWYFGNPGWQAYLDSTITEITNFLFPLVATKPSIIETQYETEMIVYPNPFNNQLNIKLNTPKGVSKVKIYSSLGEIIFEQVIDELDSNFVIDLEKLNQGYYFVLIENKGKSRIKKIAKSR